MRSHHSDKNLHAVGAFALTAFSVFSLNLSVSSLASANATAVSPSTSQTLPPPAQVASENRVELKSVKVKSAEIKSVDIKSVEVEKTPTPTTDAKAAAKRLPTVVVSSSEDLSSRSGPLQTDGRYRLDQTALEQLGHSSGSMTDVLSTLPNVQFSDQQDPTNSLKPSSISIAGGRVYDNNISINGIANTSLLDPGSSGAESTQNSLAGHEQAMFFDLDQLEEIRVYDSNVPVEYGKFVGGVVDASIKRPRADNQSKLSIFSTEADWVQSHVIYDPALLDNPNFNAPVATDFTRRRYTLSHERKLSETQGLRLGVTHQTLAMPILSLMQAQVSDETSSNVTLTHGYENAAGLRALTYIAYAPYEKTTYLEDAADSFHTLTGGGLSASSQLNFVRGEREHDLTLAFSQSSQSRSAPANYYLWKNTVSINWGGVAGLAQSRAGGYGNLDRDQLTASFNWKSTGELSEHWALTYGLQLAHSEAGFDRPLDAITYDSATVNTAIQCLGDTETCTQREQYFRTRKIYPSDSVSVYLNEVAAFSALDYKTDRWLLSLGARVDHDDFLGNTNIAWRNRARWLLNERASLALVGGVNRYYGGPLLTYKLREAAKPYYQEYRGSLHNVLNAWQYDTDTGRYKYRFDNVKTPYSDEFTLALRANLGPGVGEIKYLQRDNRDEFSRTTTAPEADGFQYYEMNNQGFSDYSAWVASWDGRIGALNLGINLTASDSTTSNDTYDDSVDVATSTEWVWYNNSRRNLGELAQVRTDFARPLVGNIYVSGKLGYGLTATLKGRYKGSHQNIVRGQGQTLTGDMVVIDGISYYESLNNYITRELPASFLVDTKLVWQPRDNKNVAITAEVLNVFDSRTYAVTGFNTSGIETGRSLWLGAELKF